MKRAIPLLLLFLLLIAGFSWWVTRSTLTIPGERPTYPSAPTGTASGASPGPAKSVPIPPDVAPAFVSFLVEEASHMDSTHTDAAAAEARFLDWAKQMTEAEMRYTRDLVLSEEAPANQRIAAAFALAKAGRKGAAYQNELISQKFPSDRAEPHSEEEIRNVRNKAFALMQIDEIAARAVGDPEERARLERLGAEAKDSTIKSYIQQKLRELPSR